MIKMAIVGGRGYTDYRSFTAHVDQYLEQLGGSVSEIVSGGAQGTDQMAERYATEHQIRMRVFKPDRDTSASMLTKFVTPRL